MPISVIDPVSAAIQKTKEILFSPFNIGKWFGLGFCAFLANLGTGGGSGGGGQGNFNNSLRNSSGKNAAPEFDKIIHDAGNWFSHNFAIVLIVGVAVFLFIIAVGLLCSWLSSRGQFMFIDGIVKNRGLVKQPWHEYRAEGNSLFKFKICLGLIYGFVSLVVVGLCVLIAWSDISSKSFGAMGIVSIIVFGCYMFFAVLTGVTIEFLTHNFVVPAMYLRRVKVMAAWGIVRQTFGDHKFKLFLYFLFMIVLGIPIAIGTALFTCCTCCLAAIPYLGSVMLLPVSVFWRSYSLYFLEQFGPEWQFFERAGEPALSMEVEPDAQN